MMLVPPWPSTAPSTSTEWPATVARSANMKQPPAWGVDPVLTPTIPP